jgi:beta-lactamase regulating signal transducer with metallopeptidase domain/protocatechuate 3,4-dioxygenase beta subunit
MNSLDVSRWLWDFYLLATGLLLATGAASFLIAQPARRMALAWATAGGLVLLLFLTALPNWSLYSLASPPPAEPTWMADLEPVLGTAIQRTPQTIVAPVTSQTENVPATQILVIDWGLLATFVLLTGSSIVVIWLTLGAWQVRRLRARAQSVPQNVADLLAGFSPRRSIRLAMLADLPVPVALGLREPMILLPEKFVSQANATQLRSVLAHELAHVENRDLWLLTLLRLLMILLWPHPLFWLMRSRVRHDQEVLADMAAAELTTRTTYAEQLVALARSSVESRLPRLVSSVGLWEKPSQLTQRIKLLLDDKLTILQSCSRNWRLGTVLVLGGLAIALSLVTLTPAEVEESQSKEQITDDADVDFRTMQVRITDEAGQPIEGAKLYVGIWYTKGYQGEKIPKEYFADSQGLVKLKLPRRLHILRLWPSKPGYVPEFVNFSQGVHEEGSLIPDQFDFQLAKGTRLGGLVVDKEGQPIPGAKVDVIVQDNQPPTWDSNPKPIISTWLTDSDFNEGATVTDKDGRWQIDDAPAKTGEKDFEFRFKITHPDFAGDTRFGELQGQQQITTEALRNETAKIVLSRGKQVKGVVTDSAGKPVTDGYVVWGDESYGSNRQQFEARLDAKGCFTTSPLALGEHTFTVIAPRFRPERRVVKVDSSIPELRFELKPGKRLQVKVVDGQGMPIPNAYFHVGSWSGVEPEFNGSQTSILHNRIPRNAYENGVYVWDGAPTDAITFQISASGFASKKVFLTATDAEHVVELTPTLVVFGQVTDAKTGKPIETFNVVPFMVPNGIGLMSEWKYGTVTGQNGAYDIRLDNFSNSKKFKLRFEATGYQILFGEETFNLNDGRIEYDVSLKPIDEKNKPDERNAAYEDAVFDRPPQNTTRRK